MSLWRFEPGWAGKSSVTTLALSRQEESSVTKGLRSVKKDSQARKSSITTLTAELPFDMME